MESDKSDLALSQNQNSKFLEIFRNVPYTPIYNETVDNEPNNFLNVIIIKPKYKINIPIGGTRLTSDKIKFNIDGNINYFIKNFFLKVNIDGLTNDVQYGRIFFKNIYLKQHNKVIAKCDSAYINSRINDNNNTTVDIYENILTYDDNNEFIVPIFFWCLENDNSNILSAFHKNLYVEVELNDELTLPEYTSINIELIVHQKCYEQSFINSYISQVYENENESRNYFIYDIYTIKEPLVLNSVSKSFNLNYPFFVSSIHVNIFGLNDAGTLFTSNNVKKITLMCKNQSILIMDKKMNLLKNLTNYKVHKLPETNDNGLSYYFSDNRRGFVGIKSGLDLSTGPYELIVEFNEALDNQYCYITLEYYDIITSSNKTGAFNNNFIMH